MERKSSRPFGLFDLSCHGIECYFVFYRYPSGSEQFVDLLFIARRFSEKSIDHGKCGRAGVCHKAERRKRERDFNRLGWR